LKFLSKKVDMDTDPGRHCDSDPQHSFFRFNTLINSLKSFSHLKVILEKYLLALESWDRLSLSAAVSPSLKLEKLFNGNKKDFSLLAKKIKFCDGCNINLNPD
jgi:hypothetical protein